jgi:putative component of toxin-antitoxin plasmid stabilization module
LREIKRFCFVLVTVVRIKVEVCADLHRSIRKCRKRISLQKRVPNRLNRVKFELLGEMSPDGVGVW